MRALSPLEREVLEEGQMTCGDGADGNDFSAAFTAVFRRLRARGLVAEVYCALCDNEHAAITATGRLALRIDNIARSVTSSC